jgi:hypothetical protein
MRPLATGVGVARGVADETGVGVDPAGVGEFVGPGVGELAEPGVGVLEAPDVGVAPPGPGAAPMLAPPLQFVIASVKKLESAARPIAVRFRSTIRYQGFQRGRGF